MNDSSFGNAIAGHTDSMKALYDRIDPDKLVAMWVDSETLTSLVSDNSAKTTQLEKTVDVLKSELEETKIENQRNNKELYDKIFDLMNQIEKLKSK